MFGKNEKLPILKGDGDILQINEMFVTLQGEATYSGVPAVFVRLSGCNLSCKFCDTDFDDVTEMSVNAILEKIMELKGDNNINLVVITGGEPFRQPIAKLCDALIAANFKTQIETNGTLYRKINQKVEIICSPKSTNNGYLPLREDLLQHLTAIKFLISTTKKKYQQFNDVGQNAYNIPVYLQPMDEYDEQINRDNLAYTMKLAMQTGAIFSLQLQKILKVR